MTDLKDLRAKVEAATSGPWTACRINGSSYLETTGRLLARLENPDKEGWCSDYANFSFIAAINPQVIIELLDRIEKAETALRFYGPHGDFDLADYSEKITEDCGELAREYFKEVAK